MHPRWAARLPLFISLLERADSVTAAYAKQH
uniref:PLEKHA6 protein n=1 Tax=Homo sapiens TaxID=9606 RepID=Q96FR0_HUMAN|nr:PLEKHA6 protein [Homo sapiens]